jgi:hypothetical protein
LVPLRGFLVIAANGTMRNHRLRQVRVAVMK